MKAFELLIKHIEAEGVRYIFGIPGSSLMPIFHGMAHPESKVKPIVCKHEGGAAFMADGYARVSGNVGVCCGTTGPGTTNLITAIASSYMDSIPVLVLTAQVATSAFGKGAVQESTGEDRTSSSVEVLRAFTKSSLMVFSAENLSFFIKRALKTALHHRMGPVHLNLPPDILKKEIPETEALLETYRVDATYFDRNKVKEAAEALLQSRRPVFLIGFGTVLSSATEEIRKIAELLAIPVATTPKAKGAFPENHPLSLGVFGLAGSHAASSLILPRGKSDLLFTVGTDFDEWSTNGWDPNLKGEKFFIQVDVEPTQIGKNYPANIGLVGDAKTILRELWFEIHRKIKATGYLLERCIGDIVEHKRHHRLISEPEKMDSDEIPIKPQRLFNDIRKAVPEDGIFFIDTGNNMLWAIHYLKIFSPGTFMIALSTAPMGYSIGAAIGGKLAKPDVPVLAICGDGGFLMHGMEMATAVNYGIPVVCIVLNDSRFNLIYQGEQIQKKPGYENFEFKPVNFARIARGIGARGYRVTKPDEIIPTLKKALKSKKPCVIDVVIDKNEISPLKERIRAIQKLISA